MSNDPKMFVEELRQEWKTMWISRFDDKERAEGIANKNYELLFVDRGLVIFATRTFKAPEFREILEKYLTPEEAERYNPNPSKGGIRKFIKEYITSQNHRRKRMVEETRIELENLEKAQQIKQGGRGWLHLSMPKK
jgi:hypothetical protein